MLAGVGDYLFAWQLPFIGLFIIGWLLGGGWLMQRFMKPHVDRRRAGVGRGVVIMLLAGSAAAFAMLVVAVLFRTLDQQFQTSLSIVGAILGVLVGLAVAYVVVYTMLPVTFVRAAVIASPAFGGVLVLAAAIGIGVAIPSYSLRQQALNRDFSRRNLQRIYAGLRIYYTTWSQPPKELSQLLVNNLITEDSLHCPSARDPNVGYFYFPRPIVPDPNQVGPPVVCEYASANDGNGRLVLHSTSEIDYETPDAFREILAKPENADFAEALKAAENK